MVRATKTLLDEAYSKFHLSERVSKDPLSHVKTFSQPKDQEVIGLLMAVLAYGNVQTILSSGMRVVDALGKNPHQTLLEKEFPPILRSFRHRFTTGDDLEVLYSWLGTALRSHDSLENFFLAQCKTQTSMKEMLSSFIKAFTAQPLPKHLQPIFQKRRKQLRYLLSDPEDGSACKRLNLYLRWMVRKDAIDLGLWSKVDASKLMLPLDTHLLKVIQDLGWTKSQSATWKVVEIATEKLRAFDAKDPVRYDFSLCHLSMAGFRIHGKQGECESGPTIRSRKKRGMKTSLRARFINSKR